MFFEYYTEKLWGRHPREIDASWGAQRTKGLSVSGLIKDYFGRILKLKNREVNTSLIEEFKYPKLGPGELWEIVAGEIREKGGVIIQNARVKGFENRFSDGHSNDHEEYRPSEITSVIYENAGNETRIDCDYVISSMPVRDLIMGMKSVPGNIRSIAEGLPYRDYIAMGVLVKKLKIKNQTNLKTIGNIVPDCWVYVQDRNVKTGRFQIFNNWSPYLVRDIENTVWIGMEYFCNEGDELWAMPEDEFAKLTVDEMIKIGLIESGEDVLDHHREKVRKAYPAYFDTYSEMDKLVKYLNTVGNLYCVGRNGQHRYNNIDHSMLTSFEAVKCILNGSHDRTEIWKVNTEKEYHEQK